MKARIATNATTAAITAPVWLRMRMRSGSAAYSLERAFAAGRASAAGAFWRDAAAEMAWLLPLHWCNASTACVREMVQDRPTRRAFAPGALLVSYRPLAGLVVGPRILRTV